MSAPQESLMLPVQANYRAAAAGEQSIRAIEFPLFSDSDFLGAVTGEGKACWLMNTVPISVEPGRVQVPLVLRVFVHTDLNGWYADREKTSDEAYHGGWVADEVAALASLVVGRRLRAGDASRTIEAHDPLGYPLSPRQRGVPSVMLRPTTLVAPSVVGTARLDEVDARLATIAGMSPDDCIALVQAARLYQDALWVVESEPHLAWLMLVSALERAANRWRETNRDPSDQLAASLPKLTQTLKAAGGDELVAEAAEELAHLLGSTTKFVSFVVHHLPEAPPNRPSTETCQVDWTPKNLRKVLNTIYEYRSRALHAGKPFPAPMCLPPERLGPDTEVFVERGLLGLGMYTIGSYWTSEDVPINLHTFLHLARGALLNWWTSVSTNPPAPRA